MTDVALASTRSRARFGVAAITMIILGVALVAAGRTGMGDGELIKVVMFALLAGFVIGVEPDQPLSRVTAMSFAVSIFSLLPPLFVYAACDVLLLKSESCNSIGFTIPLNFVEQPIQTSLLLGMIWLAIGIMVVVVALAAPLAFNSVGAVIQMDGERLKKAQFNVATVLRLVTVPIAILLLVIRTSPAEWMSGLNGIAKTLN